MKKLIVSLFSVLVVTGAFAATYTNTMGSGLANISQGDKVYVVANVIDFSVTDFAAGETMKVLDIPANASIQSVKVLVQTATTNANSGIKVGDSADDDGYVTVFAPTSTTAAGSSFPTITVYGPQSTNLTVTVSPAYGLGKTYTAANYLLLTSTNTLNYGKVKVEAVVVDTTR